MYINAGTCELEDVEVLLSEVVFQDEGIRLKLGPERGNNAVRPVRVLLDDKVSCRAELYLFEQLLYVALTLFQLLSCSPYAYHSRITEIDFILCPISNGTQPCLLLTQS